MSAAVRIPADINRPDPLIGSFTGRQLVIGAAAATLAYLLWNAARAWLPLPVLAVLIAPIAVVATVLAIGRRDGLPLDRLLAAAFAQRLGPRYQLAHPAAAQAPPPWLAARTTTIDSQPGRVGPLHLPARTVTATASVDLGPDGVAMAAVCSTVSFALRNPDEQQALVAVFGRYLDSLSGPTQILIRTQRLDLTPRISELGQQATALAHPALRAAALGHAEHLAELGRDTELLRRQVLLVVREPCAALPEATVGRSPLALRSPLAALPGRRGTGRTDRPASGPGAAADDAARRAAETRLARRLAEAGALLAPAGITVHVLTAAQTWAVLAEACNPGRLTPTAATTGHPAAAHPTPTVVNAAAPSAPGYHAQPDGTEPGGFEIDGVRFDRPGGRAA